MTVCRPVNLLGPGGERVIQGFLSPRGQTLIALDYDGTLARIRLRPASTRMRLRTEDLLRQLAGLQPVVVVSGRSYGDLKAKFRGFSGIRLIGNHGMDWGTETAESRKLRRLVREWLSIIRPRLSAFVARPGFKEARGIEIEDKGETLSLHFRACLDPVLAELAVKKAIRGLPGARQIGGHLVVNLVPRGAPDKGDAVIQLMREFGVNRALYVGDDRTDEDVFRLACARRFHLRSVSRPLAAGAKAGQAILGIHVGNEAWTGAQWRIPHQREIDRVLNWLVRSSSK